MITVAAAHLIWIKVSRTATNLRGSGGYVVRGKSVVHIRPVGVQAWRLQWPAPRPVGRLVRRDGGTFHVRSATVQAMRAQ